VTRSSGEQEARKEQRDKERIIDRRSGRPLREKPSFRRRRVAVGGLSYSQSLSSAPPAAPRLLPSFRLSCHIHVSLP